MDKLLEALHKNLQRVKHRGREGDVPIFLHEPLMLSDLEQGLAEIKNLRSFADDLIDDRVRLVHELCVAREERDEARRWARHLYRVARQAQEAILDLGRRTCDSYEYKTTNWRQYLGTNMLDAYDALDQVLGGKEQSASQTQHNNGCVSQDTCGATQN